MHGIENISFSIRERKSTVPASIIVDDSEKQKSIDDLEIMASQSWNSNQNHMGVFVRKFKRVWDDICTLYVDMYLDKHPISKVRKTWTEGVQYIQREPRYICSSFHVMHRVAHYNFRLMK